MGIESSRSLSVRAEQDPWKELLIVQPRYAAEHQQYEAQRLATTYTGRPCRLVLLGRSRRFVPNVATYLGSGAVETLKQQTSQAEEIFINAILTGVQVRNLEEVLGLRVLDRIALIVNIFAERARTREAKLQVELACLQLARTRLVRVKDSTGRPATFGVDGTSQVVSARERSRGTGGQGGLGGGGQGEKEIVLQRSRLLQKIRKLKNQIEAVKKTRQIQRQARKRNSIPVIAVVGYTNAGKSTLVSKLTKAELECDDLYFKTLDPVSRQLKLSWHQSCVISDTVGFISDLPICLFAAFRSTLEEASHADLILHVIDANAGDMQRQRLEVYKTLQEVGVTHETLKYRTVEAYNKVDRLEERNGTALLLQASHNGRQLMTTSATHKRESLDAWLEILGREEIAFCPRRVLISALNGTGMKELRLQLENIITNAMH